MCELVQLLEHEKPNKFQRFQAEIPYKDIRLKYGTGKRKWKALVEVAHDNIILYFNGK